MNGLVWLNFGIAISLASVCPLIEASPGPASVNGLDAQIRLVNEALEKGDSVSADDAVLRIKKILKSGALRTAVDLKRWLKSLSTMNRFDEVQELAVFAITTSAANVPDVEYFQTMRVRALLSLGRSDEALRQAKALFNVSSMSGTGAAIQLLDECLTFEDGVNRGRSTAFRREQVAGERYEGNGVQSGMRCATLDAVKVDDKEYDKALAELNGTDFESSCARGNLLLLSDRPLEARKAFELAYSLAPDKKLTSASENIARAIKAEDGTVGRANAWVLSIRPQERGSGLNSGLTTMRSVK